jgi:hypothetical protein
MSDMDEGDTPTIAERHEELMRLRVRIVLRDPSVVPDPGMRAQIAWAITELLDARDEHSKLREEVEKWKKAGHADRQEMARCQSRQMHLEEMLADAYRGGSSRVVGGKLVDRKGFMALNPPNPPIELHDGYGGGPAPSPPSGISPPMGQFDGRADVPLTREQKRDKALSEAADRIANAKYALDKARVLFAEEVAQIIATENDLACIETNQDLENKRLGHPLLARPTRPESLIVSLMRCENYAGMSKAVQEMEAAERRLIAIARNNADPEFNK